MTSTSQIRCPRAILFDNDGVLSASEPLHWSAWGKLLEDMKIPYVESEIRALVGKTAPEIMVEVLNHHRPGWDPALYDVHALALRKNDYYLALAKAGLKTYPGVIEGLEWLRRNGIRTAMVTNAKRREAMAISKLLGLGPLLDEIVCRDDCGAPKPDPAPYLFAAAALALQPEECMAVEDSPPGLEAGLMAGMPAAALLTNFSRSELERPVPGRPDLMPVWIGETPQDFFDWIKSEARSAT